ncbi:MFS transporter [Pseudomonas sp. SWRI74]|uniref:MFS transporter n=1 Tax=Pseudomonas azerbaijanoccidentalis TaxID=2842347 RepID=A0ABS6QR55_9PSED|nr:MFS transporter [Pseudomonas azerbaijanoccidentalis]MBV4521200.1 MFS transporter [Pseudomonas azerbaijanoccidentalis]
MTHPYRWKICALLFFATTINYLDRQVLGLLKPVLELQFHWSETDYSYLVVVFQACYAAGLLIFGRLIDRLGTKLGYGLCLAVWSLAAVGHAAAQSTFSFMIMRALLGLGESGNFPAAIKAVSEWFPKKERALAVGILTAGTSIGAILAPACVPWLASHYGWQAAFVVTGLTGFVWLIFWKLFYDKPGAHPRVSVTELAYINQDVNAEPEHAVKWRTLLTLRATWAFIAGKFLTDPIWWFMLFWLPSYFTSRFGLSLADLALPLMIVYCATSVGSVAGGWLSSRLIGAGWPVQRARRNVMLCMAVLVTPLAASSYIDNLWTMVALLSLAAAAHQGWSANIFTTVADNFPRSQVASVMGIGSTAGSVGGMIFPLIIGLVLDHYKALEQLNLGYNILFILCASAYLVAWVAMRLIDGAPAPASIATQSPDSRFTPQQTSKTSR